MQKQKVRIVTDLHVLSLVGVDIMFVHTWLENIDKMVTNFDNMTIEFKLRNRKRTWTTLPPKKIKQCEAQMIKKKHCKEDVHRFALVDDGD